MYTVFLKMARCKLWIERERINVLMTGNHTLLSEKSNIIDEFLAIFASIKIESIYEQSIF